MFFIFDAITDESYNMLGFSIVKFLVSFGEKTRRKETTRNTSHRWENNIKIDVKEGCVRT
jgi:hypothetical protein